MILVTGAAGKTGQAVMRALARRGTAVRALIHKPEHGPRSLAAGATELAHGDLLDFESLERSAAGVAAIYHICPNVHPLEVEIGRQVIAAAQAQNVPRFVFHSVLHPQIEGMPHHWRKMRVEELLFASGLEVTILQPSALMQNLFVHWSRLMTSGILAVPFSTSQRFSLVALEDVAEVASQVLTEAGHGGATYELCGAEELSHEQIAEVFEAALERPVEAIEVPLKRWREESRGGLDDARLEALSAMFSYYDAHGFVGNANVLKMLLAREPTTFHELVAKQCATRRQN